jgi:beta-carotene 3-hydroxylase
VVSTSIAAAQQVQEAAVDALIPDQLKEKRKQRMLDRQRQQTIYKVSAIAASLGVTALAIAAVHYRFSWHARDNGAFPTLEACATLLLTIGGVVGMEMYARWAHRALWHDFRPGWLLHKSHHEPRIGAFEANDVFAVMNAVPAMGLCAYGFLTPTFVGGLCFGAGLGITLFGIMYMFVHDGLVHRRFPVGPIAEVPYLKRVAIAHQLHHSEKYNGVPWGMFLGPQELEAVGGKEELDRMVESVSFTSKK